MCQATDKPMYHHDCDHCTFLGQYEWRQHTFDLYHCIQGGGLPTVIARFSSDGPDYESGISGAKYYRAQGEHDRPTAVALQRAMDLDLKVDY